MKIAAIVLTLFPNIVFSQATAIQPVATTGPSAQVTKVVRVRYGNARALRALATDGAPVSSNADSILQVIVLRGRANDVAAVEQTIHELDMPASAQASKMKDVELIVSVIGGSDKNGLLPESQTSEAILPVIKQLRAIFPYKNYQLLSSMLLRSRDGGTAGNSGIMKNLGDDLGDVSHAIGDVSHPSSYGVAFDEVNVAPEQGKSTVYIRKFRFDTKVPIVTGKLKNDDGKYSTTQWQNFDVSIQTDVHLQEGQKIVVGKANVGNSDLALFVVLMARLVD